nr:immunoglobulin heavy chain junction region [Mus musculus]
TSEDSAVYFCARGR